VQQHNSRAWQQTARLKTAWQQALEMLLVLLKDVKEAEGEEMDDLAYHLCRSNCPIKIRFHPRNRLHHTCVKATAIRKDGHIKKSKSEKLHGWTEGEQNTHGIIICSNAFESQVRYGLMIPTHRIFFEYPANALLITPINSLDLPAAAAIHKSEKL
jgi:hypothetical protein